MSNAMMVTMVWYECWDCGVPFGMSEQLDAARRADGKAFYCVKGCRLGFGEGTVTKLERELEIAETRASHSAVRAHLAEERARELPCPSCKRRYKTEQGLLRHMRNVHKQPLKLAEHAGPNAYNAKISGS